jgi:CRISPR-associated protein Csm1
MLALGDHLDGTQPRTAVAIGRRFLVNVTPILTEADKQSVKEKLSEQEWKKLPPVDSVKPYDVMEKQSQGIPRLGILRMDVDNMGDMFTEGLGENASLARLASLSFAVHLFFDGWVGHLAKKRNDEDKRGHRLYSIYSGGDDLFFVGSWDAVAELAVQIRTDLARYTGQHPGVHASAGIVLVGGKYPLSQAAQDAGRAEKAAKDLQWLDGGKQTHKKDAITFLGKTLPWERFGLNHGDKVSQTVVLGLMRQLREVIGDKGANKQLLRLLINLQLQYDEAMQKKREVGKEYNQSGEMVFPWGPWMWRGAYYLSRMYQQAKEAPLKDEIKKLQSELETNFHSVEWIGLAARWTELLSR